MIESKRIRGRRGRGFYGKMIVFSLKQQREGKVYSSY